MISTWNTQLYRFKHTGVDRKKCYDTVDEVYQRTPNNEQFYIQLFQSFFPLCVPHPAWLPLPPSGDMVAVCAAFIFSGKTWSLKAVSWKCLCIQAPKLSNKFTAVSAHDNYFQLLLFFTLKTHLMRLLMFKLQCRPEISKISRLTYLSNSTIRVNRFLMLYSKNTCQR